MIDEIIGTIVLFPYGPDTIIPENYILCDGRQVPLLRYGPLFSVIGTAFGGNGTTTFGIPNLNYTIPVGAGPGETGIEIPFGKTDGEHAFSLTEANLATHTHPGAGEAFIGGTEKDSADYDSPMDAFLRTTPGTETYSASADKQMGVSKSTEISSTSAGEGKKINNMQPTIGMAYYICHRGKPPVRT